MQYVAFMVVFVAFGVGTGQHIFTSTSAGVQVGSPFPKRVIKVQQA
jgi:hypothetical protein